MWPSDALWHSVQMGLGYYYVLCALLNQGFAFHYRKSDPKAFGIWSLLSALFGFLALANFAHAGPVMPQALKHLIDALMGPVVYTSLSVVGFIAFMVWRRWFTDPHIAWGILVLSLLAAGFALTDYNFFLILSKADNAPIPMLIYSVGFFTWLAMRRGVLNDDRIARGEPPLEKLDDEKVLVWPDLVYTELIAMVVCTVILIVWGIVLKAPLEQPATSAKAPNPSKAPWYFLGLQEMLVYYDPWMAGVVLPTFIIIGLVALPYIDYNQKGNGYFTFKDRPFAIVTFLFGFIVLWVTLIVLGTILRGPNWNFFGPFTYWDSHKVDPLNNVNLSQIVWLDWGGKTLEGMPWYVREAPGIFLCVLYLLALPPLLAATVMKTYFLKMGFVRFILLVTLIQFMAALPIKMVLRWVFNLKYIVALPEVFFNI